MATAIAPPMDISPKQKELSPTKRITQMADGFTTKAYMKNVKVKELHFVQR